ncbi:MAG: enoyl-CoA hydratase/isomerase family protein [Bacteroidota bacterium]|nr:enoyl-CoA hydratase/isomerase family protein [Bacteroidota bacterium]MDP4229023.1 enoyl-CoA hydratase/isomerase family protein [Bacteroidota bacterium]
MARTRTSQELNPYREKRNYNFSHILYEKNDYVATLTINRPEVLNCLNLTTLREMITAFEDTAWDDDIAVLVITGAGEKAFCTGADLREQEEFFVGNPNDYYKWMRVFIEMHESLRNIGKPTVARLNGMVVGGGNEVNLSCDLAIAADHIIIKQVGAARGSVAAAGATQWLPLTVGDRRAREIIFLCEEIPAEKALDWGLVNQVVPKEELDHAVAILCEKLYNKLPECLRYAKQQLNFWKDLSWHTTIGHARDWLSIHNLSDEVSEGINAFNEKRDVNYKKIRKKK